MGNQQEHQQAKKMTFREACKPYFEAHPLLFSHSAHGELDGNAVLYTMHYFLVLHILGEFDQRDIDHYKKLREICEIEPGFWHRGPHKKYDRQAHDDNVGAANIGALISFLNGALFWDYGRRHGWFYLYPKSYNPRSLFRAFWMRLPGLIPHFQICASKSLTVYAEYGVMIDLSFTAMHGPNYSGGRLLDWHKIHAYERYARDHGQSIERIDNSVTLWKDSIKRNYGSALMGGVFKKYFPNEPNNPFIVYMDGKI